jgi:hypothetical protein
MTHIYERWIVKCPLQIGRTYLEKTIQPAVDGGGTRVIMLRLPVGPDNKGKIEKNVVVTYGRGTDPMHFDQVFTVHWTPRDGGPYPDFDGTMTVRSDEVYTTCILELEGEYKPPLGFAGAAFDAIAGARIASATARELLREIGADMERSYHAQEAMKHDA